MSATGKSSERNDDFRRSNYAQTFARNHDVSMNQASSSLFSNKMTGFLSVDIGSQQTSAIGNLFQPCGTMTQCTFQKFQFNGRVVTREVPTALEVRHWNFDDDAEKCGPFGIFLGKWHAYCTDFSSTGNSNCCQIDRTVAILYHVLCDPTAASALREANGGGAVTGALAACQTLHFNRAHQVIHVLYSLGIT
jgi:hypothetical protein